jgi:hypothetical protein
MAEVQQVAAKPSLIDLVFGSRIAQAVGIFGVAFTLFQGLEPFLKFSRFMGYLVTHWRELTGGLWNWLGSLVHLHLPAWTLDLMTLILFLFLFSRRASRLGIDLNKYEQISVINWLFDRLPVSAKRSVVGSNVLSSVVLLTYMAVVPVSVFLVMYVHLGFVFAATAALIIATGYYWGLWFRSLFNQKATHFGFFINSERAILALIGLLGLNYLAHYSHALEAFIETATR